MQYLSLPCNLILITKQANALYTVAICNKRRWRWLAHSVFFYYSLYALDQLLITTLISHETVAVVFLIFWFSILATPCTHGHVGTYIYTFLQNLFGVGSKARVSSSMSFVHNDHKVHNNCKVHNNHKVHCMQSFEKVLHMLK